MKKIGLWFCALFLLFGTIQAEMVWVGLNPDPSSGNYADSATVNYNSPGSISEGWSGSFSGFQITAKVVDSSAGAISEDSSVGVWLTYPINTEDVVSATGIFEVISITDTSTATGHLFALGGDSVFVWYTVKTGNIAYDPDALTLVTAVEATTVSGTAIRVPITLPGKVEDTLFKAFTWMEIALIDTTRWGEVNTAADAIPIVDSNITGTWVPADTMVLGGAYDGIEFAIYSIHIFDPGGDKDSIISIFQGSGAAIVDTALITESAQNLDSGMTINFDDDDTATDGDVFIFVVGDSLHYGKAVTYKMRAGLNLHRR